MSTVRFDYMVETPAHGPGHPAPSPWHAEGVEEERVLAESTGPLEERSVATEVAAVTLEAAARAPSDSCLLVAETVVGFVAAGYPWRVRILRVMRAVYE